MKFEVYSFIVCVPTVVVYECVTIVDSCTNLRTKLCLWLLPCHVVLVLHMVGIHLLCGWNRNATCSHAYHATEHTCRTPHLKYVAHVIGGTSYNQYVPQTILLVYEGQPTDCPPYMILCHVQVFHLSSCV